MLIGGKFSEISLAHTKDFLIFMHDLVADELKYAAKELRDWEIKDHPQYRGDKR